MTTPSEQSMSAHACGCVCVCVCVWWWYSHSSGDPHAAHPVGEAMRPQGRNVILLDLHLVALEVRVLEQADLVLQAVLHRERERGGTIEDRRIGVGERDRRERERERGKREGGTSIERREQTETGERNGEKNTTQKENQNSLCNR